MIKHGGERSRTRPQTKTAEDTSSLQTAKKARQKEPALKRVKFCPKCGSANVFWASGIPQLWSLWECRECGYRGTLILEDSKLAEKLRKEWKKKANMSFSK